MKTKLFLTHLIFLIFTQIGFSQSDTIIYLRGNNKPANKENATSYVEVKKNTENIFEIKTYYKNDIKWILSPSEETAHFLNDTSLIIVEEYPKGNKENETLRVFSKQGDLYFFRDYHSNNKIKKEGLTRSILPLHLEGEVKVYYKSGTLSSIMKYNDNQLISNQNWLENGEEYYSNIFKFVDVNAEYPGGISAFLKYVRRTTRYPHKALLKKIQGQVLISFIVNENGKITGGNVVRSVNTELDLAALKFIKHSRKKWSPAILDGKPVKQVFRLPITFKTNKKTIRNDNQ